jgi:hypothetical protein
MGNAGGGSMANMNQNPTGAPGYKGGMVDQNGEPIMSGSYQQHHSNTHRDLQY